MSQYIIKIIIIALLYRRVCEYGREPNFSLQTHILQRLFQLLCSLASYNLFYKCYFDKQDRQLRVCKYARQTMIRLNFLGEQHFLRQSRCFERGNGKVKKKRYDK
jgi:hypothetical protein